MALDDNTSQEIRQLAFYEVHPEAISQVLAAIKDFVAYIRLNEPGTLRYEVWQEPDNPARFVHIFVFRDHAAHQIHSDSAEVEKFAGLLYPQCLKPVRFIDYQQVASKTSPSL